MAALDIFAFIVLMVIVATIVGVFIFLGVWPGKVAQKNNHSYLEAVTIGSWIALVSGGVLWPIILIWAYTGGPRKANDGRQDKLAILEQRIAKLETRCSQGASV